MLVVPPGPVNLADLGAPPGAASSLLEAAQRYWLPALAVVVVTGVAVAIAAFRRHHHALNERERVQLVPTETFNPTAEEIRRLAAGIADTRRRRDWTRRGAEGVRIALSSTNGGLVTQHLEASRRVLSLLEPACLREVQIHRPEPEAEGGTEQGSVSGADRPRSTPRLRSWRHRLASRWGHAPDALADAPGPAVVRARAELRITPSDTHALAALDLDPDPLTPIVAAFADLAEGESATLALDLQPLSAAQRRRQLRSARGRNDQGGGSRLNTFLRDFNGAPVGRTSTASSAVNTLTDDLLGLGVPGAFGRLENRDQVRADYSRFAGDPAFSAQLLVWAEAATRDRARAIVDELVAGLAPSAQRAAWRRVGFRLGNWIINGADSPGRRVRFDHRARTGCHHPVRSSFVGSYEIAGLLKPPTSRCYAANFVRGGGAVPPPPPGLPDWSPEVPGLFPIGEITDHGVHRLKGVPLADSFWSIGFGRTRAGKTEMGLVRMLNIARQPDVSEVRPAGRRPGLLYDDPHGDGLAKLKPYLVDQADRVVEVDLSIEGALTSAGWNPLDMTGCTPADIEGRVSMMTAAYSAVLGWTGKNNRGLNLVTQAVAALCQLGLQLPPHLQPNIFSIVTILDDEDWRREILPYLSEHQRSFLSSRLGKQSDGEAATSPVTNLLDLMRVNRKMAALFGQSRSTFNLRECMDAGRIVLLSPGPGVEDYKKLIQCLFLLELFRATTSRHNVAIGDRRIMHAFVDELQVADRGSASALIAMMLQEGAKFGLRGHFMVQQPTALQAETLRAFSTNVTHIFTNTVGAEDGPWLCREFGGLVTPWTLLQLERFHAVASVTHASRRTMPFRYRGVSVESQYGPPASPTEVAALDRTIDRTMGRRNVDEVIAELDTHDQRILLALTKRGRGSQPADAAPASADGGRRRRPPAGGQPKLRPESPPDDGVVTSIDRARGRGEWRTED